MSWTLYFYNLLNKMTDEDFPICPLIPSPVFDSVESNNINYIDFAMGWFWIPDAYFTSIKGINDVVVGWGGHGSRDVGHGHTFDPIQNRSTRAIRLACENSRYFCRGIGGIRIEKEKKNILQFRIWKMAKSGLFMLILL